MEYKKILPLVSLITPCYNGEKYLERFLDSVLAQTYDNIEFILVNDGSTDDTEKIALSYQEKFADRGYIYIYIVQNENKGLSSAINQGLKILKGKYFMWADADDLLDKDNVLYKVKYLEKNKDKAIVAARASIVDEEDINKVIKYVYNKFDKNWYNDIVFSSNATTACGIYMVRTKDFFNIYPERNIYESREGQNWQMLLPLAYKFSYGNIPEVLYKIVVRKDSHSRIKRPIKSLIKRCDGFIDILENVSKFFSKEDKELFLKKVYQYYSREKFIYSIQYNDIKIAKECYKDLKERKLDTIKDNLKYWRYRIKMFFVNIIK